MLRATGSNHADIIPPARYHSPFYPGSTPFCEGLIAPPPLTPAMERALERHRQLIGTV
jgi:hypothetical protein